MRRVIKTTVGGTVKTVDLLRSFGIPATFGNTFVALGTSIAAGAYSGGIPYSYPTYLATRLTNSTGKAWTATNAGLSGDTTTGMLSRLPALLTANRPRWCTIEVSINDTSINFTITSAQTLTNIQAMVTACKSKGATPVLIGSAPWDQVRLAGTGNNAYDSNSPTKAIATNTLVSNWAAANGVPFVDLFAALGTDTTNLVDGLHPNSTWQDRWAQAIAPALSAT